MSQFSVIDSLNVQLKGAQENLAKVNLLLSTSSLTAAQHENLRNLRNALRREIEGVTVQIMMRKISG